MAVSHAEVRRLLGDLGDHLVAEIQATGATAGELQEVAAHLAQETDVMGELERPLTGRALTIYNMLKDREEAYDDD